LEHTQYSAVWLVLSVVNSIRLDVKFL